MALAPIGTDEDLEGYFSSYGIASWADHEIVGDPSATVVKDQCELYASSFLAGKLSKRYTYAMLLTAPMMVEIWCVILLRTLTFRRGNPPPASLEFRYQELTQKDGLLDQIAKGEFPLVDENGEPLRPKNSNAPGWSNLHIDRWYPESKVRVITGNSDQTTSRLPRKLDRFPESFG